MGLLLFKLFTSLQYHDNAYELIFWQIKHKIKLCLTNITIYLSSLFYMINDHVQAKPKMVKTTTENGENI